MVARRYVVAIHAIAGVAAFLTIFGFLASTLIAELAGDAATVAHVKAGIAWGLLLLAPALAASGGSGFALAGRNPKGLALRKLRRTRIIGANGLVVLAPCVLFLAWKGGMGSFDAAFVTVQGIEILAGSVNLLLIGLNIRDGLRLSGHSRATPATR